MITNIKLIYFMDRKGIIGLEIRRNIYNHILDYPGMHLRKLSRSLKIPKTTLMYHLKLLEKEDFLIPKKEKRYIRYYAAKKVGNNYKNIISIFRKRTPLRIILFLFLFPSNSILDISLELEISMSTISYHINKLISLGVVQRRREGYSYVYNIKYYQETYNLLVSYKDSFSDDILNYFFEYIKYAFPYEPPPNHSYDEKIKSDDIIDMLLENLPNPYYM
jgi:predicted transcriptional regulator